MNRPWVLRLTLCLPVPGGRNSAPGQRFRVGDGPTKKPALFPEAGFDFFVVVPER